MPPSHCDLANIYGAVAARLPHDYYLGPAFTFKKRPLPAPPETLSTSRILLTKGAREYNSWYRADMVVMFVTPETCRELGVFLIACGLHGPRMPVTLRLTHPECKIRQIVIREGVRHKRHWAGDLVTVPVAFHYRPQQASKFPFQTDACTCWLPLLALSNGEECVGQSDQDWQARDTIWIQSGSRGTFRFAELLLNAGSNDNENFEYSLEGEAGYRSLAPMSTELKIYLPGADFWIDPSDPADSLTLT